MKGKSDLSDEAKGRPVVQAQAGQVPVQAKSVAFGKTSVSVRPKRTSVKLRLADGSETDCRAEIHLAREAHLRTIFRDIPFSEAKARAIFDKAIVEPERFGLINAVPGPDVRRRAIISALIAIIRLKGSRLANDVSAIFALR
ncbi:hypothetical protein FMN63_02845 [Stappia sp. BW2]|uniref:hypothetical protein n=1 Tax=Stappia sp. BW2 TaxID=2592622 RepID=UPI0011DEE6B1|nr:hypothetical protein [Stappia sp. BW2]TYC78818.1 hypothetical protein FMN63_02845 [Stappia sp. BW2]